MTGHDNTNETYDHLVDNKKVKIKARCYSASIHVHNFVVPFLDGLTNTAMQMKPVSNEVEIIVVSSIRGYKPYVDHIATSVQPPYNA